VTDARDTAERPGRSFQTLAVPALTLSLVVLGALAVRKHVPSSPTLTEISVWDSVTPAQWAALSSAGHRIGPGDASIEFVLFIDYDCSACRQLELALNEMRSEFPNDLAVLYRHYPLSIHRPQAYEKARLAECAAGQGRFAEAHDYLIQFAGLTGVEPEALSGEAGLREPEFLRCASDSMPVPAIERDLALIHEIRTGRAPSLFMDGAFLTKSANSPSLRRLIESRLDGQGPRERR